MCIGETNSSGCKCHINWPLVHHNRHNSYDLCQSYDELRARAAHIFLGRRSSEILKKKSELRCVYLVLKGVRRYTYTNWPLVIICLTDHHLSPGHVSKSFNARRTRGALERGGVLSARSLCSRGGRDNNPSYFLLRRTRTLDAHRHKPLSFKLEKMNES
jgi:hypothetical protein